MKNIYLAIFLIFISFALSAQKVLEVGKKEFKIEDKDGYKEAKDALTEGLEFYSQGKGGYPLALKKFEQAQRYNPNNAELNYMLGICYLFSVEKEKSIELLNKTYQQKPSVSSDILFFIARGYHLTGDFETALEKYKEYKQKLSANQLEKEALKIQKLISECENGIKLRDKKERVFIDNLGAMVNSKYPDYSPLISADESMMIFTSRRDNTTGENRDPLTFQYYEDIYYAEQENKQWKAAKNIGKPLNTAAHDATVGMSADGQQLFIFNSDNGGDIFACQLKGNEWSKPKGMRFNSKYKETSASFSYTGNTIYFVSDRPEDDFGNKTKGGRDIFVCNKNEKGKWDKVKNLDNVINTPYDEEGIFMHPDGKTMYFSSKGHNSMGGYDIFKTESDGNGGWSKPENIGVPINTPDDDVFFVVAGSGRRGYYSSTKKNGLGEKDIYMITFLGPEKPLVQSNEDNLIAILTNPVKETVIEEEVELKTMQLTILKGIVKDAITLDPIEAEIEIVDNEKNEVVFTQMSNSATGKFLVSLPSGKNYGIAVKAEGYLFHSENFNIPDASSYQEIEKEIILSKVDVGSKIVLNNVFFDYAKATLRSESFPELDRLYKLLSNYPSIRIEISGHTDNRGSKATNQKLSQSRAKSVVDYLIKKGIKEDRLEFVGKDFQEPVATNDTEEGRQQNRRVEFKVLSK